MSEFQKNLRIIAQNIKDFRKESNLSQIALAEKANVHEKTIISAESGTHSITIDVISKIANALNKELYEMFLPQNNLITESKPFINKTVIKMNKLDKSKQELVYNMIALIEKFDS